MGAVDFRRQEVKLTAFKTPHHPPSPPLFSFLRTLEYHREELQLREMDGAAAVSDLVRTMRLSGSLCGACLAPLNPTLPSHLPPPFRRLTSFSWGDWGDNH